MDGDTGMIILYVLLGFFGLIVLVGGTYMGIMWRRRKYIYTYFLDDTGQWVRDHWMPKALAGGTFMYGENTYKFDIKKCTRDYLNRPVAHYYVGNPEPQLFSYKEQNKKLNIGTREITQKDFHILYMTKVLRDIFQDEEVMTWLMIILIAIIVIGITVIIFVKTHNPPCILKEDNVTSTIIKNAVIDAIKGVPR